MVQNAAQCHETSPGLSEPEGLSEPNTWEEFPIAPETKDFLQRRQAKIAAEVGETAADGAQKQEVPLLTKSQHKWLDRIADEEAIDQFRHLTIAQRTDFAARLGNKYRHLSIPKMSAGSKEERIELLSSFIEGEKIGEIAQRTGHLDSAISWRFTSMANHIADRIPREEVTRLMGVADGSEEELPTDRADYKPPAPPPKPAPRPRAPRQSSIRKGLDTPVRKKRRAAPRHIEFFNRKKYLEEHPSMPVDVVEGRYDINSDFDTKMCIGAMINHFKSDPGIMIRVDATHGTADPNDTAGYAGHDDDSLREFMNGVRRYRLLKGRDEEAELMRTIKTGVAAYRHMLLRHESHENHDELMHLAREGTIAFNTFFLANVRLAILHAHKYSFRARKLEKLDLMQMGFKGLHRAIEKFDETKGFKFSTYATWWIRQTIERGMADEDRTIRIPVHIVGHLNKLQPIRERFMAQHHREPTPAELADAYPKLTADHIEEYLRMSAVPESTNKKVGEHEDASEKGDFIKDEDWNEEYTLVDNNDVLKEALSIADLSDEERFILSLRFGIRLNELIEDVKGPSSVTANYEARLDKVQAEHLEKAKLMKGATPKISFPMIGKALGLTAQRVEQIEKAGLKKLYVAGKKMRQAEDKLLRPEDNFGYSAYAA